MNCPVDNAPLTMTDRQGVEIDYCPTCRGVWLDRGELDKIIERAADETGGRDRQEAGRYEGERGGGKRRESFLSEIFDFEGKHGSRSGHRRYGHH